MREEEGNIHFSADCLGDYENLYGPWRGDIKKRAAEKKNLPPSPVAYIMNAALVGLHGNTDTTARKSAIEEMTFWKVYFNFFC